MPNLKPEKAAAALLTRAPVAVSAATTTNAGRTVSAALAVLARNSNPSDRTQTDESVVDVMGECAKSELAES